MDVLVRTIPVTEQVVFRITCPDCGCAIEGDPSALKAFYHYQDCCCCHLKNKPENPAKQRPQFATAIDALATAVKKLAVAVKDEDGKGLQVELVIPGSLRLFVETAEGNPPKPEVKEPTPA